MKTLRRWFVFAALSIWMGGFTFYSSVVIPVAHDVLGSHREVGFITKEVTTWLNRISIIALLILAENCLFELRASGSARRPHLPVFTLGVMLLCQLALFAEHPILDKLVDVESQSITSQRHFLGWHRVYLLTASIQWLAALLHLWWLVQINPGSGSDPNAIAQTKDRQRADEMKPNPGADTLLQRGLLLEYITLGWNAVGTIIVSFAGVAAGSVALTGFALDSLVEIGASTVVIWQLCGIHEKRERRAFRLISVSFFALSIYILAQSARTYYLQQHASSSPLGVFWLSLTFVAMLLLAAGKLHTGAALGNEVLKTEARVTLVDAYLAGSVLIGLVSNSLFGWWWADPLAGLVIVFYGVREGFHAWKEATETA